MPFDAHKNLAIATIATAPSPATSGTSLVVGAGEGARFPAAPFNATVWPADMAPDPTTAEVVRVTARTTDTLTITRAQESTAARAIVAGDLIAATITAKSLTDIESGVNFPQLGTTGNLTFSSGVSPLIQTNTADGADNATLYLTGAGGFAPSRGPYMFLSGNEVGSAPGEIRFVMGDAAAAGIQFSSAVASVGRIHRSGGFSWGSATDPGAGSLSVTGDIINVSSGLNLIRMNTPDGADTGRLGLYGGGGHGADRGAYINVFGNEHAAPGKISLVAGDVAGAGHIEFLTGPTLVRGMIHRSGGFSWGGTNDPGAGALRIGGASGAYVVIDPAATGSIVGTVNTGATALTVAWNFLNPNGQVGYIATSGSATQYSTASDARLKRDHGPLTDSDVLRRTVVHDFEWLTDGTRGRGVFAQEAVHVAPFAVSVGTDDTDDDGRLKNPWGVDYSKYVPDLIAGWQGHDSELLELRADVIALTARCTALESKAVVVSLSAPYQSPHGGAMMFQRVRDWMDRIRAWWFPKDSAWVG